MILSLVAVYSSCVMYLRWRDELRILFVLISPRAVRRIFDSIRNQARPGTQMYLTKTKTRLTNPQTDTHYVLRIVLTADLTLPHHI